MEAEGARLAREKLYVGPELTGVGGCGRRRPRLPRVEPDSLPGGTGSDRPRFGVDDGVAGNKLRSAATSKRVHLKLTYSFLTRLVAEIKKKNYETVPKLTFYIMFIIYFPLWPLV